MCIKRGFGFLLVFRGVYWTYRGVLLGLRMVYRVFRGLEGVWVRGHL